MAGSFWGRAITKDNSFEQCVVLDKDAFDPDAVFLDDIVDDDVLPYLTLAVDGLNTIDERATGRLDLRPDDILEKIESSTTMPVSILGPEQLEVYGWESTLWRKIRGYLGFWPGFPDKGPDRMTIRPLYHCPGNRPFLFSTSAFV